jgi:chloramphenicol 3-O-phosphotransferase
MLIILNGVPNAGKTSVAKVIQAKIPNTVHLAVDVHRTDRIKSSK